MGYTHHWLRPLTFDPVTFGEWREDCEAIIRSGRIPICGWDGRGDPALTLELVSFNGCGRQSVETFHMPRVAVRNPWDSFILPDGQLLVPVGMARGFCKTRLQPYDTVVTACLLALAQRFPAVRLYSDGGMPGFAEGRALLRAAIGKHSTVEVTE